VGRTSTLPIPDMETFKVFLNFESVDEIIWCDHLNETSPAVLLHSILKYIEVFHKMKFEIVLNFDFGRYWEEKVKGLRLEQPQEYN